MSIQQFIIALIALLASYSGQSFEQVSSQAISILAGRGGTNIGEEYVVVSGNGVNPAFDNTGLSGIPDSWGDTSLAVVIGASPANGAALRARTGLANTTGYIHRFDLYVASSSMTDGQFVSVAVGKEINSLHFDEGDVDIAYYLRLTNVSGALKLSLHYPTSGGEVSQQWSGTVSLNTVYTIYIEYSISFDQTVFRVDSDTVATIVHDSAAVQSIGTLVLGSSAGSTGRNIVYLIDRILENPLPSAGQVPTNAAVSSPANGATDVEVSTSLVCTGTRADTWEVRYETVNPPVGAWTSAGATGVLGPLSLANNTTYYVQCRPTNENGVGSASAVSSFTTVAATSTGTHPALLINATREATWTAMRADYLEDPTCLTQATTNERVACELYKSAIAYSNAGASANSNNGVNDAWLANVPGNDATTHCDRAWNLARLRTAGQGASLGADPNNNREHFIDVVLIYDWCYQSWSQTRRDTYLTNLNALAATVLSAGWYGTNGWKCGDVDQPIGNAFGIWALFESTKSYNPDIVTLVTNKAAVLGAYTDADALSCKLGDANKHARNMIKAYFGEWADGGAWFEGSEYSGSAFLGIQGCEALRTTDAADDPCTEIDTWVDDHASYLTHALTRDNEQMLQTGDLQTDLVRGDISRMTSNGRGHMILALTGLLPDGSVRQHLWRQYLNLRSTQGAALVHPTQPSGPGRSLALANPYITAAADLSALSPCYQSLDMAGQTGNGIHIWNDGTTSDATQFWVQLHPENPGTDHATWNWGVDQMYRKGQWARTHPFSYDGVAGHIAEGVNSVMIEGLSTFPRVPYFGATSGLPPRQSKKVNGYTCGSDYMVVSGTQGGMVHPALGSEGNSNYFPATPRFVHEDTATYVYLSSATKDYDSVVMLRRVNAEAPSSVTNYTNNSCFNVTCFTSAFYMTGAEEERIAYFPRWSWFNHHWTEPTVSSLNTTWTLPDGQLAQLNWLSPDTVTITKEDLTTLNQFCTTVEGSSQCPALTERKWRTTVKSSAADTQWNMLAQVFTVRDSDATAPTITELSVTGTCGAVLISRTGNDDRIVVYNTAQGDSITQTHPTATQANAVLSTARYHKAKTCTIPWTQTTASATVLSLDMNPSGITWTSNLDSAGAVSATPDSSGVKAISVSGTGAHSLDITGS